MNLKGKKKYNKKFYKKEELCHFLDWTIFKKRINSGNRNN